VAEALMIALSACGRCAATWRLLNPPHEMPIMPTLPSHHGCSASHSITWQASSCSVSRYSSNNTPSESPLPRMSTRTLT